VNQQERDTIDAIGVKNHTRQQCMTRLAEKAKTEFNIIAGVVDDLNQRTVSSKKKSKHKTNSDHEKNIGENETHVFGTLEEHDTTSSSTN